MFKCTGICSKCGRCKAIKLTSEANDRKTRITSYPDDFSPQMSSTGFGVAFDIGTTTVVGFLWNLNEGNQIGVCAKTNPQNEFGLDVISRITFCADDDEKLSLLRTKILDCLNEIIADLSKGAGITFEQIQKVTVCGNTTMSHIFAGYSPKSLAFAPFNPEYVGLIRRSGKESGLDVSHEAEVLVVPNIAGHVGGDITAGLVAIRILDEKQLTVFIDIGTNGEIVLTDGNKTYACSTAAGPAFEGSAILHGMRAADGAIEKVKIEAGEVLFKTIGEVPPQGICGSGLIDVISEMVKHKLISKTGRLISKADAIKKGIDNQIIEHLIEVDGERQFVIVFKENDDDIVITQNDIREVQLAKGAIAAGITLMLKETGKTVEDIEKVVVAGAFGSYIDKESAMTIGLLPRVELNRIISAGNTAGAGVAMTLASDREMDLANKTINMVEHIELASKEDFQNTYLSAMAF